MLIQQRSSILRRLLARKPPSRQASIAQIEAETAELLDLDGNEEWARARMSAAELWAQNAPDFAAPKADT